MRVAVRILHSCAFITISFMYSPIILLYVAYLIMICQFIIMFNTKIGLVEEVRVVLKSCSNPHAKLRVLCETGRAQPRMQESPYEV